MFRMFAEHWVSWTILGLLLLWALYTLIVVKEEKETFLENAVELSFHQFLFQVPSWWGETLKEEKHIRWERTDTRYEWQANLYWEDKLDEALSIEEDFKNRIEEMEIVFDLDTSVIKMPEELRAQILGLPDSLELVRVEGTATQSGIERRYLDAFLIRDHERQTTLFATSLSSVLNGLIEGPYFEHMMTNFQLQS